MPEDVTEFVLALRRRDDLVAYLDRQQVPCRVRDDDHPERPGSVQFEMGGERWVADYWRNGNFKMMVWG